MQIFLKIIPKVIYRSNEVPIKILTNILCINRKYYLKIPMNYKRTRKVKESLNQRTRWEGLLFQISRYIAEHSNTDRMILT